MLKTPCVLDEEWTRICQHNSQKYYKFLPYPVGGTEKVAQLCSQTWCCTAMCRYHSEILRRFEATVCSGGHLFWHANCSLKCSTCSHLKHFTQSLDGKLFQQVNVSKFINIVQLIQTKLLWTCIHKYQWLPVGMAAWLWAKRAGTLGIVNSLTRSLRPLTNWTCIPKASTVSARVYDTLLTLRRCSFFTSTCQWGSLHGYGREIMESGGNRWI